MKTNRIAPIDAMRFCSFLFFFAAMAGAVAAMTAAGACGACVSFAAGLGIRAADTFLPAPFCLYYISDSRAYNKHYDAYDNVINKFHMDSFLPTLLIDNKRLLCI